MQIVISLGLCGMMPVAPQLFSEKWWWKWMKAHVFVEAVAGVLVG